MLLLALLLAPSAPQEAAVKTFTDWVVGCDNGHRCAMTSLFPGDQAMPDEDSGYDASMLVTREAGPGGGFTIEVSAYHDVSGKLSFRVDGAVIASGTASDNSVTLTGADAARAIAAMTNGKEAALVDAAGKPAARISLAGSSAALRYIDADQGRVGTVTAAVAKGTKPAGTVRAAPAPETVAAVRPWGAAASVSKAMRAGMEKQADCEGLYDGADSVPEVETYALGGGKTLALLPCGAGAYNFSTVAFIVAGGKAVRADLDGNDDMLTNAGFSKGVLSSYAKGRGIGDCGNSESYVWDGKSFRLIEARGMDECRGSTNWLTYYRATPVFH
jgi:hypothetical protein